MSTERTTRAFNYEEVAGGDQAVEQELDADTSDAEVSRRRTAILDVKVSVQVVIGSNSMPVGKILRLGRGAIIELDRKIGEPVEVFVSNRLVARGELVIVEGTDDKLGVALTEIFRSENFTV